MLQGAVAIIFGVAIIKSDLLSRWIGAVGIAAGVVGISSWCRCSLRWVLLGSRPVANISTFTLYPWIVILGIFMWRKTRAKKMSPAGN